MKELAAGMSLLTGDSAHGKLRAAFDAFDVDCDGNLSYAEVCVHMLAMIRIFFAIAPDCELHFSTKMGFSDRDVAMLATAHMFRSNREGGADDDQDGFITYAEYLNWYKPTFWFVLADPLIAVEPSRAGQRPPGLRCPRPRRSWYHHCTVTAPSLHHQART